MIQAKLPRGSWLGIPWDRVATILRTMVLVAYAAPAMRAQPALTDVEQLRQDLASYKAETDRRVRELEERLRQAESRATETQARTEEVETKIARTDMLAKTAAVRAENAAAEAHGTSEALRDFGTKPPEAGVPLEVHGYLRAGAGIDEHGRDMVAFKAPGAWAKYRLGNEAETYGELLFRYNYPQLKNDTATWNVQVRLAYVSNQDIGFPVQDTYSLPEAFVQARDVVAALPGAAFWIGERFYRRVDIQMNDFFLSDSRGFGGGVEDITLGDHKFALAYIASNKDDINLASPRVTKRGFDARLYGMKGLGGDIVVWGAYGRTNRGFAQDGTTYAGRDGAAAGIALNHGSAGSGLNKFTLQYGSDAYSSLTSAAFRPASATEPKPHTFRVTDQYAIQPNEHFGVQVAGLFQDMKNASGDSADQWTSFGIRPVVFFTRHTGLSFEAGWDHVKNDRANFEGSLWKLTVAPQLQYAPEIQGHPVPRLYGTYACWDDSLKGRIGGSNRSSNTDGLTFGLQAETSW